MTSLTRHLQRHLGVPPAPGGGGQGPERHSRAGGTTLPGGGAGPRRRSRASGTPHRASARLLALPLAAGAALWLAGVATGPVTAAAALWAAAAAGALAHGRRGLVAMVGAVAWVAAAAGAAALTLPWMRALPVRMSALVGWLLHGTGPVLGGTVLVAAGGWALGRLASGLSLRARPDPVHWLFGACIVGLVAVMGAPVLGLLGAGAVRVGEAALAAASGLFWPLWAEAEPLPPPPPPGPARFRLTSPIRLPRTRRQAEESVAAAVPASTRGLGPRRRRRLPLRPREGARRLLAALGAREQEGVLPVTVRLVSAAANARRLLGLHAYAALCSVPALWLLLLGPRSAYAWLAPAHLRWPTAAAWLGSAALAPAACVAVALRCGFVHRLELTLPRPRLGPGLAPGLAAAALLAWGGPHGPAVAHGLSGVLLHHPVPAAVLDCLVLPAVQAAFFFGLVQTRLGEIAPRWQALGVPAALFALSGPLTGAPLPALPLAFAVGLLLAWSRRRAGLPWTAAALALGNGAGLAVTLLR